MLDNYDIIDISQPVNSRSAVFPGDTPFSKTIILGYPDSKILNLTAITMSPHIGTHADAPIHIYGDLDTGDGTASSLPLQPFLGPAIVIDLAPLNSPIAVRHVQQKLSKYPQFPKRILIKTMHKIDYEVFAEKYAHPSAELAQYLAQNGVVLLGIDGPSMDDVKAKNLIVHNKLLEGQLSWLENLDLTHVAEGEYFLIALPVKFTEIEAAPVRAVLLKQQK